jgi:phosphoglycerate kinase
MSSSSGSPPGGETLRRLGLGDLTAAQLAGKRVVMRVDYNVPLEKKTLKITNNQRITETLASIDFILKHGASLVLLSHLGRPDGKKVPSMSLKPVAEELQRLVGPERHVIFIEEGVSPAAVTRCQQLRAGADIALLENLRFDVCEEGAGIDENGNKIKADPAAVKQFRSLLTSLGDVFVNDAFGTAHRAHSSMVGVQLETRAAGFLMKKELDFFARALENPARPFLAILGGAKVSDKIKLIENLLDKVDAMIIGGGMAFTFKKVMLSKPDAPFELGSSLFDAPGAELVPRILQKAAERHVKLVLPVDYVTANSFANTAAIGAADDSTGIPVGWMGLDIGPKSAAAFAQVVRESKTIIWNGPMGVFEFSNFQAGTRTVFEAMAALTAADPSAVAIVGGGDTATAAQDLGFMDKVSHVSTGGGASLELLEGRVLPGVSALSPAPAAKL